MAEESTSATTVEVPADLARKAKEKGWPLDLVEQALAQGGQPADLIRFMDMGVDPEQARAFLARSQAMRSGGPAYATEPPPLDLSWMHVPTEWGIRAKPTKRGLTMGAINIGTYGEVPDTWEYQTEMPRGAMPIPGVEGMGYSIYQKQEVWADNCADLYEEAIQRRWRPATDVPWDAIRPLPDDIERAFCQICTHLSEKAQLEGDVLAGWLPEISYGYHEVKVYLSTVIFECGRHVEVFRKRALANGGGLGIQSPGWGFRSIVDSRNYTEMAAIQMVLQDSFTLTQLRYGEMLAPSEVEKTIFRLAMQDKARHVAYGLAHLKYVLIHRIDRREEINRYLDKGEALLLADDKDTPTREAFAILLGGGKDKAAHGLTLVEELRRRQVQEYMGRLEWALLRERREKMNAALRQYLSLPAS